MRILLRGLPLACLVAVFCSQAGADRGWRPELNKLVEKGHVAQIDELLTDEYLSETTTSGSDWLGLVRVLERYSPFLLRLDGKTFGGVLDRVLAHATKSRAENEGEKKHSLAWAFAAAARCRSRVHSGHKKAQPEWRAAADAVSQLYDEDDASSDDAFHAAGWLAEAAAARGESDKELLARAKEIIDAVTAKRASQASSRLAVGRWYLARARAALVRKSKSAGRTAVKEGLAFLSPLLACGTPAPALVDIHSELLAHNWAGRFGVKEPMRLRTVKRNAQGVIFLIPESTEWVLADPAKSKTGVVTQRMLGKFSRRTYMLQAWKSDTNIYVDRDQTSTVPVADTKEFATTMLATLDQFCGIQEVTKRHKARKAKLHKDFRDVWHIAVEGITEQERWLRFHSYYFTPKKIKRVYNLMIQEYQPETTPDPLAEFVLKNLQLKGK